MEPSIRARFQNYQSAPLTWSATEGGKAAWVCFRDRLEVDLGADLTGDIFALLSQKMMSGNYYPPDAIVFYGEFQAQDGTLKPGIRVLQQAPLGPLSLWSMVEIFVAESSESRCEIGYVTTAKHYGRGMWRAILERRDHRLFLLVESTASPQSWLFWLGLPIARFFQLRARSRAITEFRKMVSIS